MLMITSFANPRVAQAFVDYMATQGVILTIQQHNQRDVWLADESQAERVRAELARFLENPADPRYLAASWQAGHTGSGLHYRLMITSFANPRVAQAFVDYMATQGVILTIQQHNQSDVWLADESQAERVRAELARFLENPADPRYLAASWQAGHTGSGLHYRRYPFFAALRERAGPVTWVVMIACVVVFIAMQILGDQEVMLWLAWPFDPTLKFEFWRYFTHALMHFSLMHILFNLLWWWYLGGAVEKRLGSGKLIVITLISALLSGYVQQKFSGPWFGGLSGVVYALMGYVWLRGERDPQSGIYLQRGLIIFGYVQQKFSGPWFGGLSGVVYALMGYVWLRGERDPQSGIYLQRGLIIFALIWIVAGWFDLFGMSMANGAHIAGLAVGLAMAFVDSLNARKRK